MKIDINHQDLIEIGKTTISLLAIETDDRKVWFLINEKKEGKKMLCELNLKTTVNARTDITVEKIGSAAVRLLIETDDMIIFDAGGEITP